VECWRRPAPPQKRNPRPTPGNTKKNKRGSKVGSGKTSQKGLTKKKAGARSNALGERFLYKKGGAKKGRITLGEGTGPVVHKEGPERSGI